MADAGMAPTTKKRKSRLGRNVKRALAKVRGKAAFRAEFERFDRMAKQAGARFPMTWDERYPCLTDDTGSYPFAGHYVQHTAWAARKVAALSPESHTDIGSSLYFSALVSAFVPVKFYDLRPAEAPFDGLETGHADLMKLPFEDDSIASLSCMHVVEHIGLGRYGDTMDPDGDLTAISELKRVTTPGGSLLFVVPVGRPRIQFNAHRVYSYEQVVEAFEGFTLAECALLPDGPNDTRLIDDPTPGQVNAQAYGCGCFRFVKTQPGDV
ncbi:MAG: DUF268 domain-containing protein [Leptospirillia bacterium]